MCSGVRCTEGFSTGAKPGQGMCRLCGRLLVVACRHSLSRAAMLQPSALILAKSGDLEKQPRRQLPPAGLLRT